MAQGRSPSLELSPTADVKSASSSSLILKKTNSNPWKTLKENADELDWAERMEVAFQIADQLACIRTLGSVVGNLTADNVFINNRQQVVLNRTPKIHGSDIVMFGGLIIWLTSRNTSLASKTIFNDEDIKEWKNVVKKNLGQEIHSDFENLILSCFLENVKNRPTANRLAKMLKPMSIILKTVKERDGSPLSPPSPSKDFEEALKNVQSPPDWKSTCTII